MSSLTTTRIIDNATRLGLTHTAESIAEAATRADHDQMGYLDFIDHLLAEEIAVRESRRFRNALKLSGLPHHKTLDDFDYTFQPGLPPRRIKDLATLEFLTGAGNVALLGPPGVGKTHIAIGLAVAACQAGKSIYFTTLDDLVRKLKTADAARRLPEAPQVSCHLVGGLPAGSDPSVVGCLVLVGRDQADRPV
jgi:DNA replication protein DnaC